MVQPKLRTLPDVTACACHAQATVNLDMHAIHLLVDTTCIELQIACVHVDLCTQQHTYVTVFHVNTQCLVPSLHINHSMHEPDTTVNVGLLLLSKKVLASLQFMHTYTSVHHSLTLVADQ